MPTICTPQKDKVTTDIQTTSTAEQKAKKEMQSLYDALCHTDGEPVYLSDGVWLYPNGKLSER